MTQMISYGGELIRISPKDSKKLEYSKNNGLSWNARCGGSGNYGKLNLGIEEFFIIFLK